MIELWEGPVCYCHAFRLGQWNNIINLQLLYYTGRKFGAAKSFKSSNVPLTTPRRALGDVGNTLKPAASNSRKGLALKPNKLIGKTPTTTKIFQDHTRTPSAKGKPLLQQISSAGIKQSSKQKTATQTKTAMKPRTKEDQDWTEREVMYPFTDTGTGVCSITIPP